MVSMTVNDVKCRKRNTSTKNYNESHITRDTNIISTNINKLSDIGYSRVIAENVITQMPKYDNSDFAFRQLLEVFELVCANEDAYFITKMANAITEGSVQKTRTGDQTKDYLKMKVARFKTKLHTKFNTNIDNMKTASSDAIDGIKKNLKSNVAGIKANVDKGLKKEQAIEKAYNRIYTEYCKICECDRIIKNQEQISRHYDLCKVVEESYDDPQQAIISICERVNSFSTLPNALRYTVSLENTLYTFAECNIKVDPRLVLETVTDYYLIYTNPLTEAATKKICKILESNSLFKDEDRVGLHNMFGDIAKLDIKFDDSFDLLTENILANGEYFDEVSILKAMVESSKVPNKVKVLFDKFKLETTKTPDKLKSLVYKFYIQSPDEILEELPDFLSWIRMFFVVGGSVAINPILGVVAFIADQALKITLSRKQLIKYIDKYAKELEKTEKAIGKAKNPDEKARLEAYKEQLKKSITKLKDREDTLYTEEENDARHANDTNDDDFGDLFDFNFDESVGLIKYAFTLIEGIVDDTADIAINNDLTSAIVNSISKLDEDAIKEITEYACVYPELVDRGMIANEFVNYATNNKANDVVGINFNSTLKESAVKLFEQDNNSIYKDKYGFSEAFRLDNCLEGYKSIMSYIETVNGPIHEMDISNTLKMAKEGLKKTMKELSDKDKSMSRDVDVACSQLQISAEKALMNGNREAVIKGSVIPSASKIIKTAIVTGAGWAVNPALTVIGILGWLGISKKLQAKERQLILDDIEIEINMCERYLKIAEDNNDMKAQRSLLTTKRSLERQRQRIKYKMTVFNNQKVDVKKDNDDYND